MFNVRNTDKLMNNPTLRICLVSPFPPPIGGIARWTMLAQNWAVNNPNVSFIQVDTAPRWRAIDDTAIWKRAIGGSLQLIRDYCRFIAAVQRADAVHLTTSGHLGVVRDLAICATARLLKIPVIYHLHSGRVPKIACANSLHWRMLLGVMKLANVILPLDGDSAHTIRKHLPVKQINIIPNPVDPANLPIPSPKRPGKKTLLFLGWVIPSKGIEELLSAWNILADDDWELVVAGPGAQSYQRHLIRKYTPDNVLFVGEVPYKSALQLIADSDLFVLPSHTEGFPFVILEAMILGKAIVATDVGAIGEMLQGDCGILTKPKDVKNLSTALKLLMADDVLRAKVGIRARERAMANYTVDMVFNELLSIWMGSCGR